VGVVVREEVMCVDGFAMRVDDWEVTRHIPVGGARGGGFLWGNDAAWGRQCVWARVWRPMYGSR
jgi:hypothetical protein